MSDLDRLKQAFRNHKARCAELGSNGHWLDCDVRSLAYEFIKDAADGSGGFAVKDIIEACEAVLAED